MNKIETIEAPVATDDAAWATIHTPLGVDELMNFCLDIERLYRINPLLEFRKWTTLGDNRFHMSVKNFSQDPAFEVDVDMQADVNDREITIEYASGIKKRTIFRIEDSEFGSKLTLIEDYGKSHVNDPDSPMQEVDKSLITWADYLQRFLIMWNKWSRHGWWRWYMKRVWQPMKPTARRITYMLLWITVVEIALITLGAGIYLAEYA